MAITRRWQAGFESNGTTSRDDELTSYNDVTDVTITDSLVRTGTYALYITSGTAKATQTITRTAQGRMGFAFMAGDGSGEDGVVWFIDSESSEAAEFSLTLNKTSGFLVLRMNDGGSSGDIQDTGTTPITTYAGAISGWSDTGWVHVGIDFKLDGAAGWVKVYLDGVEELSVTGDTILTDMSGYIDTMNLSAGGWQVSGGDDIVFDDMYFDDTTGEGATAIVPDVRFHYLRANANGNYSQLTGSDGDSTNNFLLVDEMPHDSDTTYVGDTALASTLRDSYGISTITLDGGASIAAIIPVSFARKGDAGTNTAGVSLRKGGTDWDGGTYTLTTSYAMLWDRLTVQPGGTKVWDQASLNSVEAGVISYP